MTADPKDPAAVPAQEGAQSYAFSLLKVGRALGLSILITAALLFALQLLFGVKIF